MALTGETPDIFRKAIRDTHSVSSTPVQIIFMSYLAFCKRKYIHHKLRRQYAEMNSMNSIQHNVQRYNKVQR